MGRFAALFVVLGLFIVCAVPENKEPASTSVPAKKPMFYKQIKAKLTSEQYQVTQACGTEPPFRNAYWNNHTEGLYVDVVSGEPLFSSRDKYNSGTGWPSFTAPLFRETIVSRTDDSDHQQRTEVRSFLADSHLGHLFSDGPIPTGMRYCINSAALRFIPTAALADSGYAGYIMRFPTSSDKGVRHEFALFSGGCFWGMEKLLAEVSGVLSTRVGYTGGLANEPDYETVCTGKTGHAESVEIEFDPAVITYDSLLDFFFRMHDPTTLNQQHHDKGTQYRSALFYFTDEQRAAALHAKDHFDRVTILKKKAVTEIVPAGRFFPAENHHQQYLVKNPSGYFCHRVRD